jgi:hypothetical protein
MSEYTRTPNLGLYKPLEGGDIDLWGGHLNASMDIIDATVGGSFLPLGGGVMTGTLGMNINKTWSGGYPGGNIGLNFRQTFTGSPPANSYLESPGWTVPLNLIEIHDTLSLTAPTGTVTGLTINYLTGGAGASGSRTALEAYLVVTDQIGTAGGSLGSFYCGATFQASAAANVGGTPGAPTGEFFGLAVYVSANAGGTYIEALSCAEFDFAPVAGATYHKASAIKLVNFAPSGMAAIDPNSDGALQISSAGGHAKWRDWGIVFGDPQSGADLPVGPSGALILSYAGTAATGIDMSASTFVNFLKGPHGFYVGNSNTVGTDEIAAVSGNSLGLATIAGNPMVVVNSDTNSPPSVLVLSSLASGTVSLDVGGGPASMTFGAGNATGISLGRAAGALGVLGAAPVTKRVVAGAWAGNTAGKALSQALAAYGLITDNTTA